MTTLPSFICFPIDEGDPENLQFVPLTKASLEELKKAAVYAEADFHKAAVEMEEARGRWVVLRATLVKLTPIMASKPQMTVAEAVLLAGGAVSGGEEVAG